MTLADKYEKALVERELARRYFSRFVPFVKKDYSMQWFHETISNSLQSVFENKVQRLMLFVPPQHGKSELSTRSLPAWVLGKNPDEKIVVASYAASLASGFNRDIQRRIDSDEYRLLFQNTKLNGSNLTSGATGGALRNSEIFEIVGRNGFVKTVGRGGGLTGTPVDLAIIDDPIKDREEAQSPKILETLWGWYVDVIETRLHNFSRVILIQTRWAEDDLAGRLLKRDGHYNAVSNPNGWVVLRFPALKTSDVNDYDSRPLDAALWPERHSWERLNKVRQTSTVTFNALYQQDPKPSTDALVFPKWSTVESFPLDCQSEFYVLDFGFTNDPTAVALCGILGRNLYVKELIYETGLTNQDILRRWHDLRLSTTVEVYCDKAEPKSIAELKGGFRDIQTSTFYKGINALPTIKGPGSIIAGINKLNDYRVFYTVGSVNLNYERNHYQWIMLDGKPTNVPIDRDNHLIDAIRGGVYTKYRPNTIQSALNRVPTKQPRL